MVLVSKILHSYNCTTDSNLINLLNVCQKQRPILNNKKLEFHHEILSFFGVGYNLEGMHPDPNKNAFQ